MGGKMPELRQVEYVQGNQGGGRISVVHCQECGISIFVSINCGQVVEE